MVMLGSSLKRGARCLWAALPLIFAGSLAFGQSPEIADTLPEHYFPALRTILENALRQSPQMIEHELEIAPEAAKVYGADAAKWPHLSGTIDYAANQAAISGNNSTQTRDSGLFYRFEMNQALFQWGAIKNESVRSRIGVAIAEKRYVDAYRQLALSLRSSYLALIVRKATLNQVRERQRLREGDLAVQRDNLKHELASPGEVFSFELSVRDTALDLQRQEVEFTGMRRTFARAAGLADLPEEEIPADVPKPAYAPELATSLVTGLRRDGAQSAFEVQLNELRIREADLSYRIARVRNLPKFEANAGFYQENTTNATSNSVNQQGVTRQAIGVRGEWSIFDGFATRGAKLEALANKRLYERRRTNAADAALEDAQRFVRLLTLDAQTMALSDQRRDLAAGGLEQLQVELKLGNVAQSAVDSQAAETKASIAASAAARAQLLGHWCELVSLAGADPVLNNSTARHAR